MASTVVESGARPRARSRPGLPHGWGLMLVPAVLFLAVFFLFPIGQMVVRSLTDPSPANYREVFDGGPYLRIIGTSFRTAAIVTVLCVVVGYPYAYAMRRASRTGVALLAFALLIPFWSSLLVRSFAWLTLLQDTGVVNRTLISGGLIDEPLALVRNALGVTIGMTHIMLPYFVLPLFAVMSRVDLGLVEAARSLGATPWRAFRRVFLAQTLPGVLAGALLVFVLSLGFYITPALLGGPRDQMIGQLIADQTTQQVRFGFASALGLTLLVLTMVVLAIGAFVLARSARTQAVKP